MKTPSVSVFKLAILAALLINTIVPTFGKLSTSSSNVIVITEKPTMAIRDERMKMVELPDTVMDNIRKMANQQALKCVDAGWYCNTIFGPSCCTGCCLAAPVVGGICLATSTCPI